MQEGPGDSLMTDGHRIQTKIRHDLGRGTDIFSQKYLKHEEIGQPFRQNETGEERQLVEGSYPGAEDFPHMSPIDPLRGEVRSVGPYRPEHVGFFEVVDVLAAGAEYVLHEEEIVRYLRPRIVAET